MKLCRFKFKLTIIVLIHIVLSSCEKESDNIIEGQLLIRETNLPLKGYKMIFDVVYGHGFFAGVDRAKYFAISDENGRFSFKVAKSEIGNYFWVNANSTGEYCIDTFSTQYGYQLVDFNKYILKNKKTRLYYSPNGLMSFYVAKETFNKLGVDTILVSSKYDTDTIINTHNPYNSIYKNKNLFVEFSANHTFTFRAIKNNKILKQCSKDIYVRSSCALLNRVNSYSVEFDK